MAINFSGDYSIKGSSATLYGQNGATSDSAPGTYNNIGFYSGSTEHIRFDDYGIVTNVWGSPGFMMRKTESGTTPNQNPIPMTVSYDVRGNVGTRGAQPCFTAPLTGMYRVSISQLSSHPAIISIIVNGGAAFNCNHMTGLGVSYIAMTSEIIYRLTAGDQVQAYSWNNGGVWGDGWGTLTCSFLG